MQLWRYYDIPIAKVNVLLLILNSVVTVCFKDAI